MAVMLPATGEEARDRRRAPRMAVGLPVELEHGKGWTRDVSASGVYFETDAPPAVGTQVRFALLLPYGTAVRVECAGEVVRVERHEDRVGVAATIAASRLIREDLIG